MIRNDFTIQLVKNTLAEKAMSAATPKKYSGTMFEAAEIIEQLRKELERAKSDLQDMAKTVENIRIEAEPETNDKTDDMLSSFCERYCKNAGTNCFKEGAEPCICDNWKWRGERE